MFLSRWRALRFVIGTHILNRIELCEAFPHSSLICLILTSKHSTKNLIFSNSFMKISTFPQMHSCDVINLRKKQIVSRCLNSKNLFSNLDFSVHRNAFFYIYMETGIVLCERLLQVILFKFLYFSFSFNSDSTAIDIRVCIEVIFETSKSVFIRIQAALDKQLQEKGNEEIKVFHQMCQLVT